ncbi:SDR family oxidoreductase [Nonomuraea sp. NPDC050643]|uniref:SDR family oxidoreductase n=1 Tax=Nonomuraea sp. NPDC050643 TaxID=3155660 RepID=UPI0033E1AB98
MRAADPGRRAYALLSGQNNPENEAGIGVRINGVSPGPVRTAGTRAMLGENVDALGRANLRDRIGEPEEIASVVQFLIEAGSSYINGTVVVANGGEPSSLPE